MLLTRHADVCCACKTDLLLGGKKMKKKFKSFGRSSVSLLLSLLMIVSCVIVGNVGTIEAKADSGITGPKTMYYTANENWRAANAKQWIYLCNGTSNAIWVEPTLVQNSTDTYTFDIPSGNYRDIIFARMDPNHQNANNPNFDSLWNKTPDITLQTDGKNWAKGLDSSSQNISEWDTFIPQTSHTVYVENINNWSNVYAYAWDNESSPTKMLGNYPGTQMSIVNEPNGYSQDVYSVDVSEGAKYIIFSNGLEGSQNQLSYNGSSTISLHQNIYSGTPMIYTGTGWEEYVTSSTVQIISNPNLNNSVSFTSGEGSTQQVNGSTNIQATATAEYGGKSYYFKNWDVTTGSGTFGDQYALSTSFTPSASSVTITGNYTNYLFDNITYSKTSGDTDVTNVKVSSLSAGDNKLVPGGKATLSFTKNGNTSISSFTLSYTDTNNTSTTTSPYNVTGTSFEFIAPSDIQNGSAITVNYTTQTIRTYTITAYIDDSNRVTKRKTFDQSYHASISAGGNTVTSTTNGMIQMEVNEGTPVTLTLHDDNAGDTTPDDFIIDKWVLSETVSGVSTTCTERNRGSFSITFTPTCSIDAVGYFKEDEGVELSGAAARYLMFTDKDANDWDKFGTTLNFVPIKQTTSGQLVATIPASKMGLETFNKVFYYFNLASEQSFNGIYTATNNSPTYTSLNTAYITVTSQNKNYDNKTYNYGRLDCLKGGVTAIKFYLSSTNADCAYTLVPVVNNTDEPTHRERRYDQKQLQKVRRYGGYADHVVHIQQRNS